MACLRGLKLLKFRYLGAVVYDCSQALAHLSDKLGELTGTKDNHCEISFNHPDVLFCLHV